MFMTEKIVMGWKRLSLVIKITMATIRFLGGNLDCSLTFL